jgi:hypothetical protein
MIVDNLPDRPTAVIDLEAPDPLPPSVELVTARFVLTAG